jgi:DNA-binding NarL/FixJ family response regulator
MANDQTMDAPVHVAMVDDDENTHLCFKDILQSTKNFNLAGNFCNATQALKEIPRLRPDIALMDIQMPGLNGIECTKRLKRVMPHLKIVMVTGTHDQHCISACSQAGAIAFLIKPVVGDQLLATLQFAADNQNEIKADLEKTKALPRPAKASGAALLLSPREQEVISGLAEGLLYKEIAQKLGVSYATVHKYQHNIFKKLRVANRSEAMRVWLNLRNQ